MKFNSRLGYGIGIWFSEKIAGQRCIFKISSIESNSWFLRHGFPCIGPTYPYLCPLLALYPPSQSVYTIPFMPIASFAHMLCIASFVHFPILLPSSANWHVHHPSLTPVSAVTEIIFNVLFSLHHDFITIYQLLFILISSTPNTLFLDRFAAHFSVTLAFSSSILFYPLAFLSAFPL